MRESIFVIYNNNTRYVSRKIADSIPACSLVYAEAVDEAALLHMADNSLGDYFYVIQSDKELQFPNFGFDFTPAEWDSKYVHIWNTETSVRLYNKSAVISDPAAYTDTALVAGRVQLKNIQRNICTVPLFDIVFLSYDEIYADTNFAKLKEKFPRAQRVSGVRGIYQAHRAAAHMVDTDMFYVVDADAEICADFEFDYAPHSLDRLSVHVWHSLNPVNGLEYGYGGVKLFPTQLLKAYTGSPVDFTTSVSNSFKLMPVVSNITRFDTDPFSAWRSGFRECAKLASRIISNQHDAESEHRLNVWCSVGKETQFGDFAISGALQGKQFGEMYANQPEQLGLINDFNWLERKFDS